MRELPTSFRHVSDSATAIGIATLGALLIVRVGPVYAFGTTGAIVVAVGILQRPELGALLILVLAVIVPRSVLFERGIPLAGGNIKVTDLLLGLTLGSWLAGAIATRRQLRLPRLSVTLALFGFLAAALIGVITAYFMGTSPKFAMLELRPLLMYLLILPLVEWAQNTQRLEHGLSVVLVALAGASAIAVGRYIAGHGTAAIYAGTATRVIGWSSFSLLGLIWALLLLAFTRSPRTIAPLAGLAVLSLAGVFVSFQRATWLATVVIVALAVALMRFGRRRRFIAWTVSLACAGLVVIFALNAVTAHGPGSPFRDAAARLESVGAYRSDVSSGRRLNEWRAAQQQIEQHPLLGIGLGSTITFHDPEFSPQSNAYGFTTTQFYIHNSYIWLALKLGLIGLGLFLLLMIVVARDGMVAYRFTRDPRLRPLVLGGLLTIAILAITSLAGPQFNDDNAAPVAAAAFALIIASSRLARRQR